VTKVTPALAPRNQPTEHSSDDKVFEKKVVKILDKGYSMVVYLQRGIREENLRELRRLRNLRIPLPKFPKLPKFPNTHSNKPHKTLLL
jgi:hypothetical protein